MNHRRMTAAVAFLALAPATMAMAGTAWAAQADAPVHGCAAHTVCLYNSVAHYNHDEPTVSDTQAGVFVFGGTNDAVAVNNTTGAFSSEGNPVLHMVKGVYFCLYVPTPGDLQSPGKTENPATGFVQAIDRGPTAQSVETDKLLPLSDCGMS